MNRPDEPAGPSVRRRMRPGGLLSAAAALLLSGCLAPATSHRPVVAAPASEQISKEELRSALDQYDEFFESTIKQATTEIDTRMPGPATKRITLTWKVRMISANNAALKNTDPLKAFVECWTLAVRMTQFLEAGDGRSYFAENQTIAVEAARRIESDIERVGRSFLPADVFTKASEQVHAFAREHPMQDMFSDAVVRAPATREGIVGPLASILNIPLAPFRVAEGIDQGASAIRSLGDVGDRFTDIVEDLPESIRWQLQLLLLDLEQNDLLLSFLASFAQFSGSAAQLAETAQKLPGELRQQASALLTEIDTRQAGIQATLERAEKTAAAVERTLQQVNAASASVELTGQSVAEAGRAWEGTARQIEQTIQNIRHDKYPLDGQPPAPATSAASPFPPPTPSLSAAPAAPAPAPTATAPADRPFEILDYRDTANALTAAARELRALTADVRATIESQGLTDRLQDVNGRMFGVVDHTSARARNLTDHIAWRAAQLILLVFVLAIVYRFASRRRLPNGG